MEHNVVTLETAKSLQSAGFAKSAASCRWVENKVNGEWSVRVDAGINYVGFAAPSAQEIADQLPKIMAWNREPIYLTFEIDPLEQCWVAEYKNDVYQTRGNGKLSGLGDTMAEALAALWLRMKEDLQ